VPPWFGDGLAALITELEAAGPPGLGDRRTAFRQQGQVAGSRVLSALQRRESGWAQLLEQRAELLVGVQLLRAGVLRRMGKETPDFECRWQRTEFGVEVTTRARPETASAMHDLLETGLQDGPDVGVTLTRTGKLLFSEDPVKTATMADQVITRIKEMATVAAGQPLSGRIPIPELGLAAASPPSRPQSPAGCAPRSSNRAPWPWPRATPSPTWPSSASRHQSPASARVPSGTVRTVPASPSGSAATLTPGAPTARPSRASPSTRTPRPRRQALRSSGESTAK
jgi:hypothetical protein